jgi:putative tricarboxylic transport membrane protein
MAEPEAQGSGGEGGATPSPLIHRTDLWLAILILAFCGAAWYVTTTFEQVPDVLSQNLPPQWFPQLLLWTIAILTLIVPFEHRFLAGGAAELDKGRRTPVRPMAWVTAVLLALTVQSIAIIGTFFAAVLICFALPLLWGERRWKLLVPFAVLFPLAVALVFTQFLKVYFEPGIFGIEF